MYLEESKEEGKDHEKIQSNATPDPGYHRLHKSVLAYVKLSNYNIVVQGRRLHRSVLSDVKLSNYNIVVQGRRLHRYVLSDVKLSNYNIVV